MLISLDQVSIMLGRRLVLDEVTFRLDDGELVALAGPSGSGKSTLLSIIGGVRPFDSGRRLVDDGLDIAWITQTTVLFPTRTGLDNVAIAGFGRHRSVRSARNAAAEVLEQLGIAHLAAARAADLSGGEQQRVAVARALVAQADMILADEPTASLDEQSRDHLVQSLQAVAAQGVGVVIATHDAAVAARADRVLRLEGGRLRSGGSIGSLL